MLRTFRSLRLGQLALAIASVLAVTGSLGLHPEPAVAQSRQASDGSAQWQAPGGQDTAGHECLACLAHRSVSLPGLTGVVLEPGTAVTLSFYQRTERPLPPPSRTHAGRAPPASS
ncbi:MAG TPA: hypothetical protein VK780_10890 [Thermoanaerobaculia bacterium]|nr:hypothetical protein [Thermoanaerobaculia bacterium]